MGKFFHPQESCDLVLVDIKVSVMQVNFNLAWLLTRTEPTEVYLKFRNSDLLYTCLVSVAILRFLGQSVMLRVAHLEYARVFYCIVHDRSFIDHLSRDFKPDIQSNAEVRIHVQVDVLKLEAIVKSAL